MTTVECLYDLNSLEVLGKVILGVLILEVLLVGFGI